MWVKSTKIIARNTSNNMTLTVTSGSDKFMALKCVVSLMGVKSQTKAFDSFGN